MSRPPRLTSSSPWDCSGGVFDWDVALRKLDELNARVEDPTLWDRPAEAQAVSRERASLAARVEAVQVLETASRTRWNMPSWPTWRATKPCWRTPAPSSRT
jgi:peptide chain release factor 2